MSFILSKASAVRRSVSTERFQQLVRPSSLTFTTSPASKSFVSDPALLFGDFDQFAGESVLQDLADQPLASSPRGQLDFPPLQPTIDWAALNDLVAPELNSSLSLLSLTDEEPPAKTRCSGSQKFSVGSFSSLGGLADFGTPLPTTSSSTELAASATPLWELGGFELETQPTDEMLFYISELLAMLSQQAPVI
jgi:hypothetical protein